MPTPTVRVFWTLDLLVNPKGITGSNHLLYGFCRPGAGCGVLAAIVVVGAVDEPVPGRLQQQLAEVSDVVRPWHGEQLMVLGEVRLEPRAQQRLAGDAGPESTSQPGQQQRQQPQPQQQAGRSSSSSSSGSCPWITATGLCPLARTYAPMRCPSCGCRALRGGQLLAPALQVQWPGHTLADVQVWGRALAYAWTSGSQKNSLVLDVQTWQAFLGACREQSCVCPLTTVCDG